MQITRDEVRNAYCYANLPGTNNTDTFNKQMNAFNGNISKIYALHGESVNITWETSNWAGSRYPNLTENGTANGVSNWTLMESVRNISSFQLRNLSGSYFEVNVSNQTTGVFLWSFKLNGTDNITVRNSTGTYNYGVNFSYVDLLNSSYMFNISTAGDSSKKLRVLNGQNASGKFAIIGNTSYSSDFTRARDYVLNATINFVTSRVQANVTIAVSVPWGIYEI
jgi:hypothetical protein